MDRKDLDELLEKNFSNVNSWLNFAEAKNAANIAFVIACIAAIFSLQNMNIILYIVCIFLIASGIGSLISFLPRLGNKVNKNCFTLFKKKKKAKYQMDLSDEIVYNSDIVSRKYKFFKMAVYLDIMALLLLAVSIILA